MKTNAAAIAPIRFAEISRETKETQISAHLSLDGFCDCSVKTGIGFLDHMLTTLVVHAEFDMGLECEGDLHVDCHHTAEDCGIVLGQMFAKALGDKARITRYGSARIPMDESLGYCDLDISGRPFLVFDCEFTADKIGELDTQMVGEFFRAFAFNAGITLHIGVEYGDNDHHKAEAMFKALAYALKAAVAPNKSGKIVSTKGHL